MTGMSRYTLSKWFTLRWKVCGCETTRSHVGTSPSSITTFKDARCSKAEHQISSKNTDVLQINNVRGKLEMEEYLSKRVYVHLTVCFAESDTEKEGHKEE